MGINSQPLLLLIVILLSFSHLFNISAADLGGGRVGGWQAIKDVKDPHVQEIGKFAVDQNNKQSKLALKFQEVVGGETQVVAGTNYRLLIAAKDGTVSNRYEAVVWDKPWMHFRNLTSFKRV
ncbi:hypothetical protein LguiB_005247 [Lonicera macranthoides]